MSANDWPDRLRIEAVRSELSSLCSASHLLRREGQGSAILEHAIKYKRAELNDLIYRQSVARPETG